MQMRKLDRQWLVVLCHIVKDDECSAVAVKSPKCSFTLLMLLVSTYRIGHQVVG